MSKVLTFSRKFPSYHPKAGKATYFVEKILNQEGIRFQSDEYLQMLLKLNTKNLFLKKLTFEDIESFYLSLQPISKDHEKSNTIRANNRFRPGNMFSPRVWFGTPRKSPQLIFAPEMLVLKTWQFEQTNNDFLLNNKSIIGNHQLVKKLAENDGFVDYKDFFNWFDNKPFSGQIICWNQDVEY